MIDYRNRISPIYQDVIRGRGGIAGGNFLQANDTESASSIVHSGTAQAALSWMELNGAAGGFASSPHRSTFGITGDNEIIAYVALDDWTSAANPAIVAKWITGTNNRSYFLNVRSSGVLRINHSATGAISGLLSDSTTAPSVSDGAGLWINERQDVNDGAGGNTATFYTSTNSPATAPASISWTILGSMVTNVGTTSIYNSSSPLEIGSTDNGAGNLFKGKVYRALVYNGIGGTLVADFNPSLDATTGTPRLFTSTTGEVWTINGSAVLRARGIVLASSASSTNDAYNGYGIVLTGGTGSGQDHLRITDYDGTTKIATLSGDWTTLPDSTSTYRIVNRGY